MIKRLVLTLVIFAEISIWPIGIWAMLNGHYGAPDAIGKAMATLILLCFLPIFAVVG